MLFLVGGHWQGQHNLAKGLAGSDGVKGEKAKFEEFFTTPAIIDLHEAVRRFPGADWEEVFRRNPMVVISADDVGSGVIPEDEAEREWREECGRVYCLAARFAKEVYKVTAGVAFQIK